MPVSGGGLWSAKVAVGELVCTNLGVGGLFLDKIIPKKMAARGAHASYWFSTKTKKNEGISENIKS